MAFVLKKAELGLILFLYFFVGFLRVLREAKRFVVAFNLLSDTPELGYLTNKEAACLIGVAPFNKESVSNAV